MELEPIKVLDGIVKGTILATYDFACLTAFGLAFPFVRRSLRFWLTLIALANRFSPLTYLFLWVIIAAALYIAPNDLPNRVLMGGPINNAFLITMITSLVLTVTIDISIRTGCLLITRSSRRHLYKSLFLTGMGVVYFGATVIHFLPPEGIFPYLDGKQGAILELGIFALPTSIVTTKAVRAKRPVVKVILAIATAFSISYLVISSGWLAFINTYKVVTHGEPGLELSSSPLHITGHYIRCSAMDDRVDVTGYLSVEGISFLVLSPHDFRVSIRSKDPNYQLDLGRPEETTPDIVLTPNSYPKISFSIIPSLKPAERLPSNEFGCFLQLLRKEGTYYDPNPATFQRIPLVGEDQL